MFESLSIPRVRRLLPAFLCGSVIFLVGCNSGSKQTEAKLEEMQKQLDETKKELEASKEKVNEAATQASGQTGAPVRQGASKATAAAKSTPPKADSGALTPAGGTAASAERSEIEKNKASIQESQARAERAEQAAEEAKRMAAPPPQHTLASGTQIAVRTTDMITTKSAATGSLFEATLMEPLVVDGYTIAAKGATVEGVVTNSDPGGKVKGVASIAVGLRSLTMEDGRRLPIRTGFVSFEAKKSTKKDAMRVGIGTGIGAAIGAIAGGGKGAAIGAGAGAAGGTGVALATKGNPAEIPAETVLTFALSAPVKVQELKK